ncbi:MAG TPA: hypothetical protein VLY24_16850 [Bryobacteraceae bacterium]|nr:hypothetical protein [Bryobacteraceae bacterium]
MSAGLAEELRAANLRFLVRTLISSDAHAAVARAVETRPLEELLTLLRDHRLRSVPEPSEIKFRRQMDRWLGDASLLLVAWLCGYVSNPVEYSGLLSPILGNDAVRNYYESCYPVAIPWLLRLHLGRTVELRSAESVQAAGAFERFSLIYERFKSDRDLNQFLDFLDGFWYGDFSDPIDIRAVEKSFGHPDRVVLAFGRRDDQLTRLDRGIIGMVRFLTFSTELSQLLGLCEDLTLVQSGFWYFYAYWFREFETDVASASHQALDNAVKALRQASRVGSAETLSIVASDLDEWKGIIARLTGGTYADGILSATKSAVEARGAVTQGEFASVNQFLAQFDRYRRVDDRQRPEVVYGLEPVAEAPPAPIASRQEEEESSESEPL